MSLSDTALQQRIIALVGDIDPVTLMPTTLNTGVLATLMPTLWAYWAVDQGQRGRVRDLYIRVDCLEAVIAKLSVFVDVNTGQALALKLSQRVTALQAALTANTAQLDKELKRIAASKTPGFIQPLAQTAPTMPPQRRPAVVDPNDPYYGGSAWFPLPQETIRGL